MSEVGKILAAGSLVYDNPCNPVDIQDAEILDRVAERLYVAYKEMLPEDALYLAAIYVQTRRKLIEEGGKTT